MNNVVAARLVDLNRQFYQTFAVQFAATRGRIQPGVRRVLNNLHLDADVLDVGCGNGELAHELARRRFTGIYQGVDFSEGLLSVARQGLPMNFSFIASDLTDPEWDVSIQARQFTCVLAFAVFHHLPGSMMRRRLLMGLRTYLSDGERLYLSVWQFLNSPRMKARIQPWESIDLVAEQVDAGDFLLDWRSGGYGLRYVHHFSEAELVSLALETGFRVVETFYSDGQGGRLGLYQVWEK